MSVDKQAFRHTLGCFTTGVTVITTRDTQGAPIGVTANSFNSVSLDPPLVLWSLAKSSHSLPAFESATHWAVHILSAEQELLSNQFAQTGADKFAGLAIDVGIANVPLLPDCTARLQCRTAFRHEGGDHVIFIGEVVDFTRTDTAPLVYAAGKYAVATQKSPALTLAPGAGSHVAAGFDEDFLGYLLGRAQFDFDIRTRAALIRHGVSDLERFVLFALAVRDGRTVPELHELLSFTGHAVTIRAVEAMTGRDLLSLGEADSAIQCHLTEHGRRVALDLIGAAKATESEMLDRFGYWNAVSLKNLLKLLIVQMDSGVPHPWASTNSHSTFETTSSLSTREA